MKETLVLNMEIFYAKITLRFGLEDQVPWCLASSPRTFLVASPQKGAALSINDFNDSFGEQDGAHGINREV